MTTQTTTKNPPLFSHAAKLLKRLRKSENLSQEDVYFATHIHVARLESGEKDITICTIKTLCDYYRIALSRFFAMLEQEG